MALQGRRKRERPQERSVDVVKEDMQQDDLTEDPRKVEYLLWRPLKEQLIKENKTCFKSSFIRMYFLHLTCGSDCHQTLKYQQKKNSLLLN